jgi:hypothetical protein
VAELLLRNLPRILVWMRRLSLGGAAIFGAQASQQRARYQGNPVLPWARSIASTVRYTAFAPDRFKEFLEGLDAVTPVLGFRGRQLATKLKPPVPAPTAPALPFSSGHAFRYRLLAVQALSKMQPLTG